MANNFNSNMLAAFNGHTGYDVGGGEETGPIKAKGKDPYNDISEIRDSILQLVGKGYKKLDDDVAQGEFARLSTVLGRDKANKLLTNILIYNNRSDLNGKGAGQRISNYFDIGTSDKDLTQILSSVKSFGTGVLGGLNNSADLYNQNLTTGTTVDKTAISKSSATDQVDKTIKGRLNLK